MPKNTTNGKFVGGYLERRREAYVSCWHIERVTAAGKVGNFLFCWPWTHPPACSYKFLNVCTYTQPKHRGLPVPIPFRLPQFIEREPSRPQAGARHQSAGRRRPPGEKVCPVNRTMHMHGIIKPVNLFIVKIICDMLRMMLQNGLARCWLTFGITRRKINAGSVGDNGCADWHLLFRGCKLGFIGS